jgi:small-conductance mechanosensitive channel
LTGHLIVALSRLVIVSLYIRKHKLNDEIRNNFILGIDRVAAVINTLILIIAVLSLFEVSLPQLFTGISIVAAAVAILSKDYISNMINGLIIMFSNQLSLNDYVKIGDNKGMITDITLLNIHLVNDDEDLVYIPNNMVLNTDVVNYTKQLIKKATIEFDISTRQRNLIFELEDYLRESMEAYAGYLKNESQVLKIYKINKDSIQLKYQFIFLKEDREIERQIRRMVPRKVIEFLRMKEEEAV